MSAQDQKTEALLDASRETPVEEQKTEALLEKSQKTSDTHMRKWKTFSVYVCIWSFGVCISMIGPTLPNLEIFLATELKYLAWWATTKSIGSLTGGLLVGFLLAKFNPEIVFMVITLAFCACVAAAPSLGSVYFFVVALTLLGVAGGAYNAGGQVYVYNMWNGSKYQRPLLQAYYLFYSVGAVVGPLVARPFLVPLAGQQPHNTTFANSSESSPFNLTEYDPPGDPNDYRVNSTTGVRHDEGLLQQEDASIVRFVYVLGGGFALTGAVLFFCIYLAERVRLHSSSLSINSSTPRRAQKQGTSLSEHCHCGLLEVVLLVGVFLCAFCFAAAFLVPAALLASFVVKELNWSVAAASLLTALYFTAYCVTRAFAVPVSMVLSPSTMLLVTISLTLGGYVMMACLCHSQVVYMYISVVIAGIGLSPVMGCLYLWTSNHIGLTGREAGVIQSGMAIGEMATQPLTAYLFQTYSPIWLIYVCIIASAVQLAIFIFIQLLASFCRKKLSTAAERLSNSKEKSTEANESTA